jgi:hypothetical protein
VLSSANVADRYMVIYFLDRKLGKSKAVTLCHAGSKGEGIMVCEFIQENLVFLHSIFK